MNEWQPIETRPRDDRVIMVCQLHDDGSATIEIGFHWRGRFESHDEEPCIDSPTHWMPLPKPPADPVSR